MSHADGVERRKERAAFETDGKLIIGNVTLPPEGYQSRFSDALNREDVYFIPLTDVEIISLGSSEVTHQEFAVVGKAQVKLAFPVGASSR